MSLHLDHLLELKVSHLRKMGALKTGTACTLRWGDDSRVSMSTSTDRVVLAYTYQGREITTHLMLSRTPCNYGGDRPWLICPRLGCHHRAGVLFLYGGAFMCRRCTGLLYASQAETANWRANRQAWKLRSRLGIKAGDMTQAGYIERPKGKHHKTHERDINRLDRLERKAWRYPIALLAKLQGRQLV